MYRSSVLAIHYPELVIDNVKLQSCLCVSIIIVIIIFLLLLEDRFARFAIPNAFSFITNTWISRFDIKKMLISIVTFSFKKSKTQRVYCSLKSLKSLKSPGFQINSLEILEIPLKMKVGPWKIDYLITKFFFNFSILSVRN